MLGVTTSVWLTSGSKSIIVSTIEPTNSPTEGDTSMELSLLILEKRRLMKFYVIRLKTFYFHLKECEFRFNHRHQDLDPQNAPRKTAQIVKPLSLNQTSLLSLPSTHPPW